ncbi:Transmembrane emp24 domain-containing protein p24delta5, partial [Linum perenne]
VTSPYGNNIYHQDNVTHGQFAFTTSEAGNYLACFWLDEHQQHVTNISLGLEWKTGIAAKDWDSVAKKEKIEASFLLLQEQRIVKQDPSCVSNNFFLVSWCRVLNLTLRG